MVCVVIRTIVERINLRILRYCEKINVMISHLNINEDFLNFLLSVSVFAHRPRIILDLCRRERSLDC